MIPQKYIQIPKESLEDLLRLVNGIEGSATIGQINFILGVIKGWEALIKK